MNKSSLLFSEPSFIEGLSRLFDWGSTLNIYNDSLTGEEADYKALQSDWRCVGEDIREAIKEYDDRISFGDNE